MERLDASKVHYKYRSQLLSTPTPQVIKVLMISNNPREMGCLSDHLRKFTWKKFNVVATFDLKQGQRLAYSHRPHYILLDGSLDQQLLRTWVQTLRKGKQFQHTAIALLKENNRAQLVIPGVQDYLLKDSIVSDTFALKVLSAVRLKIKETKKVLPANVSGFASWLPWGLNEKKKVVTS